MKLPAFFKSNFSRHQLYCCRLDNGIRCPPKSVLSTFPTTETPTAPLALELTLDGQTMPDNTFGTRNRKEKVN